MASKSNCIEGYFDILCGMTKTPHTFNFAQNCAATLSKNLTYREVAPGISAFKVVYAINTLAPTPLWAQGLLPEAKSGLARTETVERFARGESRELEDDIHLCLMSPQALELIRTHGWYALGENEVLQAEHAIVRNDPLSVPEDWQVAECDYSSNMLFEMDGSPLPVGIRFHYLHSEGCITDGNYDLGKLATLLNQHPQVYRDSLTPGQLKVEPVPRYNSKEGCRQTLSPFFFAPTKEQMCRIWTKAKELDHNHPSTELRAAVLELDLLGARAAGVARSIAED